MSYQDFDIYNLLELSQELDQNSQEENQKTSSNSNMESNQSTIAQKKFIKKSQNCDEAKNIPKNMGVLLKNFFVKNHSSILRQNQKIRRFVRKVNDKKNYTREDLKILFQNQQARLICQEYFSSFQIIEDILKSSKICDQAIMLKYVKKLFIATFIPTSLQNLKYSQTPPQ